MHARETNKKMNNKNPGCHVQMKTKRTVFPISNMAAGNRVGFHEDGWREEAGTQRGVSQGTEELCVSPGACRRPSQGPCKDEVRKT